MHLLCQKCHDIVKRLSVISTKYFMLLSMVHILVPPFFVHTKGGLAPFPEEVSSLIQDASQEQGVCSCEAVLSETKESEDAETRPDKVVISWHLLYKQHEGEEGQVEEDGSVILSDKIKDRSKPGGIRGYTGLW